MNSPSVGVIKLACACAILAATWIVVLPWIARLPAEEANWKSLQDAHIDPSAMYYTELEAMEPILERVNAKQPWHEARASATRSTP